MTRTVLCRAGLALLAALALSALRPASGAAQGPGSAPGRPVVRLTLEESLRAALARSPEVRQASAEVEGVRGKQLQAIGAGYPQIQLTPVLGPSPRARGTELASPDKQFRVFSPDWSLLDGVFIGADIEIIQPLFTWGLLENARLAAQHGLRATRAGVEVRASEVALHVKQAYWGAVASKAILDFLLEVQGQVDDAAQRAERLMEGGFTAESDVYRLRASRAELDKNVHLVEKTLDLARAALAAWTGQPAGATVEPADSALPSRLQNLRALELFVEDALARRPEFVQLREGIAARRNLVEVERKKRYPLFFFGIIGTATYATNRDRLDNPFVFDPLNSFAVGPVLGFRYSLDFGIAAGKILEAEAEVQKLEALRDYAVEGIPLQVREAYGGVVEARQNVEAFDAAHRDARKWLVTASANFDLGLGEPRDLADAFVAYAKTRGEYLQALYAYVFGLEQLSRAAGLDLDEIQRLAPVVTRRE